MYEKLWQTIIKITSDCSKCCIINYHIMQFVNVITLEFSFVSHWIKYLPSQIMHFCRKSLSIEPLQITHRSIQLIQPFIKGWVLYVIGFFFGLEPKEWKLQLPMKMSWSGFIWWIRNLKVSTCRLMILCYYLFTCDFDVQNIIYEIN